MVATTITTVSSYQGLSTTGSYIKFLQEIDIKENRKDTIETMPNKRSNRLLLKR